MLVPLTTTGSVDAPSSTGLLPVPVVPVGTVVPVVAAVSSSVAATAGEEERCDRHEEGADHHLARTVASPHGRSHGLGAESAWRRGSLGPWRG